MTNIEQKALALVNEIERQEGLSDFTPRIMRGLVMDEALCRAIEQHEAFRQEVSEAVEWVVNSTYMPAPSEHKLRHFIIAKPDPLVEVIATALRDGSPFDEDGSHDYTAEATCILSAMKARGYQFTKIGEGA